MARGSWFLQNVGKFAMLPRPNGGESPEEERGAITTHHFPLYGARQSTFQAPLRNLEGGLGHGSSKWREDGASWPQSTRPAQSSPGATQTICSFRESLNSSGGHLVSNTRSCGTRRNDGLGGRHTHTHMNTHTHIRRPMEGKRKGPAALFFSLTINGGVCVSPSLSTIALAHL